MRALGEATFHPAHAAALSERSRRIEEAAAALSGFAEREPELAALSGVEIVALEARSLLSGGAARRVCLSGADCAARGVTLSASRADLDALSRLEGLVALGDARIGVRLAAMEAAEQRGRLDGVGTVIGVASGALGLIRAIF